MRTEPIALTTVTKPSHEAVTLEEAKDHLRVDFEDDDAYIASLLAGARGLVETRTNRALVPQTLRLTLQGWPLRDSIELPRSPISASSSDVTVQYFASGSTTATTFGATRYWVDHEHEPANVTLRNNESWPTTTLRSRNAVQVDFVAGYATVGEVPEGLKLAVKQLVSEAYENREPSVVGTIVQRLPMLDALLDSYTVWSFG